MVRRSKSEESLSNSSEEEQVNDQEEQPEEDDEEELEVVARPVDSDEDAAAADDADEPVDDEDDEDGNDETRNEISHREKVRLKEMQRLKKQKIQDILDQQNASIEADMKSKGKGRLKFLSQIYSYSSALTKTENREEIKLRVEDALNALKVMREAIVEERIVEWGGYILLCHAMKVDSIRDTLDNDKQKISPLWHVYEL